MKKVEKRLSLHAIDVSKITDLYYSVEREPIERYLVSTLHHINSLICCNCELT